MKSLFICWLSFLSVANPVRAAEKELRPNLEEVAKAGKATLARLQAGAATWDLKCNLSSGLVRVKVVRDNGKQSWAFSETSGSTEKMVCRLFQVNGFWYVLEHQRAVKARPWEAELHLPGGYLFLTLSDLRVLNDASDLANATFEHRQATRLYYRMPLPLENRRLAQKVISEFEKIGAQDPELLKEPDADRMLKLAHEELEHGFTMAIDERTGIILETKSKNLPMVFEGFQFLDHVSPTNFAFSKNVKWDDQSEPWPKSDLANCVMVCHDPILEPGGGSPTMDGYILNLKNGRLRRLPYQGLVTMPGCFLKERAEVIGSATDIDGQMGILKWNLLTGEETKISYGPLSGGLAIGAELSPDGRTLATMRMLGEGGILDVQMQVIDLESRKARMLGKAGHIGGPFGWLPNGDGLILKRFEATSDPKTIEPRILCRLGMDGKLTDLRRGDSPAVLRRSKKILYEDDDSGLWHTCELDGTKPQIYADGMKGCGTPAISPDENQIIFARYEKGKLPQLLLFDWGSTDGKPFVNAEGFVGIPVWR